MSMISNLISRRKMLAAAAAGSMITAATAAQAQTADSMPQLTRPGRGGTNPGPKNPIRAGQDRLRGGIRRYHGRPVARRAARGLAARHRH